MKTKLLRTVSLAALFMGGLFYAPSQAKAQGTWTAPAIPGSDISTTNSGNYAIYNIKADAFMGEGMSWGTNAIACRLEGSYTAALANRQKFTLSVSSSTVKMVHANHTDKGVGCASTNANDLYADYGSNNVWTFASSSNFTNAYTLTLSGYGTLDVADLWGGKLTIKNGKGYTDWAFIPESALTNGDFAKWKERKAMYDVYTALSNSGTVSTFATALATANTTYVNSSATVADLRAATRALIIATAAGIQSNTNVSALFTNADMQGNRTTENWSDAHTTIQAGAIEVYHGAITLTQSKTDVPDGYYTLIFHGMSRQDGSAAAPTFTATTSNSVTNNASIPFMSACKDTWGVSGGTDYKNGIPDKIWRAAEGLAYECASSKVEDFAVTGNNLALTVAQAATDQWFTFNGFEIQYNRPFYISDIATALPNTSLSADTWYYFDIPVAGDYVITAGSNLSNVVYTTNGSQPSSLVSTSTWNTSTANLAAGRYYVKSSSAQILAVEAASYTYTVGSATVDYEYVQGGETVTVTYADAVTNNGNATFAKKGNPTITFGGNSVSVTPTSNGFTFTVPAVTAGTSYTLSIPANAFGYAEGSTYNAAQNITFTAPAIFDGIYYLQDQTGKYVGRGSSYGTRACVNDWGLPLHITTSATTGEATLQYYDSELYVYVTGAENETHSVYADNSIHNGWTITKNGGAYNLQSTYTNTYLTVSDGNLDLTSSPYDWTLHEGSAHKSQMTALKNTQAATAATAAGLTGVTTVSGLESAVSSWNVTNVISAGSVTTTAESYQPFYDWKATLTTYTADIAISIPGLYKLTIQGFGRLASNDKVYALQQENADVSPFYAFFSSATTPLMSVMDLGSNSTNYGNNCVTYGGNYYPNGQASAKAAFQDNKYVNTIWVYIPAADTYQYGIKIDGSASVDNERWTCYTTESVSLTLYSEDLWAPLQAALSTYAPYNDVVDATDYTTHYNTYAAYTQSTSQSDMLAAITYMENNYANYQWANASIAHPVDVTDGIIANAACTSNDNWTGSGRNMKEASDYPGGARQVMYGTFDGAYRYQDITITNKGAYLLKTKMDNTGDHRSWATIAVSSDLSNTDAAKSTVISGDYYETLSGNTGGWVDNIVYFPVDTDGKNMRVKIILSNGNNSYSTALCGEMHLYYIGQSADFVKDGVHKYIGTFATAPALEVTNAVPVVDVTLATFTSGTSAVTFTNPNGLVFVATDGQTSADKNEVIGHTCATLQLADGHPFMNPTQFTATSASYTLSALAGGQFATLMLPFAATAPSGSVYALNQGVNLIDGNIYGTASSIAANTPVLVTASGNYTGSNVTVPVVASGATYTSGELVGTYTAVAAPTNSYVLQNHTSGEGVAFYLVGYTQPTVNPFRAYIKAQDGNVKAFKVLFGDADGVEAVEIEPSISDAKVFNLSGQRLNKPVKGINIVNGKKVLVK